MYKFLKCQLARKNIFGSLLLSALITIFTLTSLYSQKIPPFSTAVKDETGLFSASEKNTLEQVLIRLAESGKVKMAIYIPKSLDGYSIEEFALKTAETWKLGSEKEDNGLLLVIAPNERRMRLEVGYGLEGDLTDVESSRILNQVLAPYFKEGRFGDGTLAAILTIANKLEISLDLTAPAPVKNQEEGSPLGLIIMLVILFIVMGANRKNGSLGPLFLLAGLSSMSGSSRGGGGGSGGGFGGFSGGGSFGGGGSSSGW